MSARPSVRRSISSFELRSSTVNFFSHPIDRRHRSNDRSLRMIPRQAQREFDGHPVLKTRTA